MLLSCLPFLVSPAFLMASSRTSGSRHNFANCRYAFPMLAAFVFYGLWHGLHRPQRHQSTATVLVGVAVSVGVVATWLNSVILDD